MAKKFFYLFAGALIAFGFSACEKTDKYTNPDDPRSKEALDMAIWIEVSDITETSAHIVINPQYTNVEYFYDIHPKELLNDVDGEGTKMTPAQFIKWRLDLNREEGATYNFYKTYVAYHTGKLDLTMISEGEGMLEPGTEYFICAYTIDDNLNLASAVATKEFKTKGESGSEPEHPKEGYIDLGLTSGTLWSEENVGTVYFPYADAISEFGEDLPTMDQWQELINECQWTWESENYGYRVRGTNGKSIFLEAFGYMLDNYVYEDGYVGYYWSRTEEQDGPFTYVYYFTFSVSDKSLSQARSTAPAARSVRLVATK